MKLYQIPNAPAGSRWHSSKTGLKEGYGEVELPRDGRATMAAFLNANEVAATNLVLTIGDKVVGVGAGPAPLDELEQAELRAVAADQPQAKPPFNTSWEASDIESFILSRATVAQVETIFATLGTRFKELSNAS
jgi:hypothetical protein